MTPEKIGYRMTNLQDGYRADVSVFRDIKDGEQIKKRKSDRIKQNPV